MPANPARTFYEAIQSVWFAYILLYWETMNVEGFAVARPYQYLYPYYERDMREGKLTKEQAQELIDCWTLKLNMPAGPSAMLSIKTPPTQQEFLVHRGPI